MKNKNHYQVHKFGWIIRKPNQNWKSQPLTWSIGSVGQLGLDLTKCTGAPVSQQNLRPNDGTPAKRAIPTSAEPFLDAILVVRVVAVLEQPTLIPFLERSQANRAVLTIDLPSFVASIYHGLHLGRHQWELKTAVKESVTIQRCRSHWLELGGAITGRRPIPHLLKTKKCADIDEAEDAISYQ